MLQFHVVHCDGRKFIGLVQAWDYDTRWGFTKILKEI